MNQADLTQGFITWGRSTSKPEIVFEDGPVRDEEIDARNYFSGSTWENVDSKKLQQFWSTATLFTPEAFRYFLPGIMRASLEDKVFNLFYDSMLSPLDTGYGKTYLSERLLSLWSSLSASQIELVEQWLFWVKSQAWFDQFDEDSILRIAETLEQIKDE